MIRYGFNINFKMSPNEIESLGEKFLKNGQYNTLEVTYYENMEGVDTTLYNQAIKNVISKYKAKATVHLSDFNLAEENTTLRNAILMEVENCFKYTLELGGHAVIVHSGSRNNGIHVPVLKQDRSIGNADDRLCRAWDLSVEMMKKICMLAKEYGLLIYTENLNLKAVTVTGEELKKYLEDVSCDNLKVVFDVGHCLHTKNSIDKDIEVIKEHLEHLHIHDNNGEFDQHLPLGEGVLDVKHFITQLKLSGYNGVYMLELNKPNETNLEESYRILKKYIAD